MPSTDPVSSITNCYRIILTQYTASSSRNAQLSQLDLILHLIWFLQNGWPLAKKLVLSNCLQMIQVIPMGWHFCKEDSTARQPLAHESVIVNKLKK